MPDRSPLTKSILKVSSAKLFSLASLLLGTVLVARATDTASFGYYSVVLSLTLLAEASVGAPLDNAVMRFFSLNPGSQKRVAQILGYILKIKLFIGGVLLALLVLFLTPVKQYLFDETTPSLIFIVGALNLITLLAIRSNASSLQIQSKFSDYSRLDSLQGLFRICFTVILFLSGNASVVAYLSAQGLGTLCAYLYSFRLHSYDFLKANFPNKHDRKLIFSYIGATSAIVTLGTVTGRADLPILSAMSSADSVGQYSVAMQLAFAGTLLASYVAVVFQPKVVQMSKDKLLQKAIRNNIWIALGLSLFGLPFTMLVSPTIIPWAFGEDFNESAALLNILMIGVCADLVTMPILLSYAIQTIPRQIMVAELAITVTFLVAVVLVENMSAISMAWIVTATRIFKMVVYYALVQRKLRTIE